MSRVLLALLLTLAKSAGACVCYDWPLNEEIAESDAIFLGRVVALEVDTVVVDGRTEENTVATFEVERVWKGDHGRTVKVMTCGTWLPGIRPTGTVCTCGLYFEMNQRFFVMSSRWPGDSSASSPLFATSCTRTALASKSKEVIKAVDKALPRRNHLSGRGHR